MEYKGICHIYEQEMTITYMYPLCPIIHSAQLHQRPLKVELRVLETLGI